MFNSVFQIELCHYCVLNSYPSVPDVTYVTTKETFLWEEEEFDAFIAIDTGDDSSEGFSEGDDDDDMLNVRKLCLVVVQWSCCMLRICGYVVCTVVGFLLCDLLIRLLVCRIWMLDGQ